MEKINFYTSSFKGVKLQMGKKDIRAQANVMTLILIILIVGVLIVILWNILNPLIREKSEEIEFGTFTANLEISEIILFDNGAVHIRINRGSGGELDGLKFVFYYENGNSIVNDGEGLAELATKTYYFGGIETLGKLSSVAVAPVINGQVGVKSASNRIGLHIPSGVVSWWRFDEGGTDFIGRNDLVGVNVVEDGMRGKVASFNNDFFDLGNGSDLFFTENMAISFWIKTDSDGEIICRPENYNVSIGTEKTEFSFGAQSLSGGLIVADDNWHHVLVNKDDITMEIYVDGELDKSFSSGETGAINSQNVTLGNFNGYLDDLMIFNKSFLGVGEENQVKSIYNSQKV